MSWTQEAVLPKAPNSHSLQKCLCSGSTHAVGRASCAQLGRGISESREASSEHSLQCRDCPLWRPGRRPQPPAQSLQGDSKSFQGLGCWAPPEGHEDCKGRGPRAGLQCDLAKSKFEVPVLRRQVSSHSWSRHPLEVPSLHPDHEDGRVPPHTPCLGGTRC